MSLQNERAIFVNPITYEYLIMNLSWLLSIGWILVVAGDAFARFHHHIYDRIFQIVVFGLLPVLVIWYALGYFRLKHFFTFLDKK